MSVHDKSRRKAGGAVPVSAHPAFPAIVALWFAALLGLGSLVLPVSLFESFATASGLAKVYASAQPPLGVTARIVIAVAAAGIGAVAGLLIARKVAQAGPPAPVTRRAAALHPETRRSAAAKRPISAHEEFGRGGIEADDVLDGPSFEAPSRRRALTVTDENARSDFLEFAPLPGQDVHAEAETLDLMAFETSAAPAEPEAESAPIYAAPSDEVFGTSMLSAPASAPQPEPAMMRPAANVFAQFERAPEPVAPASTESLDSLGMVDLVERFAQALGRHRAAPAPQVALPEADPVAPEADERVDDDGLPVPPVHDVPDALRPIGLGVPDDADDDLPDLDLTAVFRKAPFGEPAAEAPRAAPQMVDPLTAVAADADDADDDAVETADESYTSLLAMKSPFGLPREPIRIEDEDDDEAGAIEPVVVFPGQVARGPAPVFDAAPVAAPAVLRPFDAPLDRLPQADLAAASPAFAAARPAPSGDTERALREALEKLQRMSGAA